MSVSSIEDVDLVYLWCDNHASRDNGELLYSLRSVDINASWIHNIYIVVENQIPTWLNTSNEKIHIVYHKEIMPKSALPTFNSNSIEHCLVNIPDLSNLFLIGNDDCFFYKKTEKSFFFNEKNLPIYYFLLKSFVDIKCESYELSLLNASKLIYKNYKYKIIKYPYHNFYPYRKDLVVACQRKFNTEITSSIYNKVRCESDIQRYIYAIYALATNCAEAHYNNYVEEFLSKLIKDNYECLTDENFNPKELPINNTLHNFIYEFLRKRFYWIGSDKKAMKWKSMYIVNLQYSVNDTLRFLQRFHPNVFCINDNAYAKSSQSQYIRNVMGSLYPHKSKFER